MRTYFGLFLIATFSSLIVTPFIRNFCHRFKVLDVPKDARRLHTMAIPRLGGVGIYISIMLALSTLPLLSNILTNSLRAQAPDFFITLVPASLVFLLGVYDDVWGANAVVKFLALALISSLFYAMGGRVETLVVPFSGPVHLPTIVGYLLTVFWLVGISNAFNLIDGVDGLAPGAALFSCIVMLLISVAAGNPMMIVVTLLLSGALIGFLRYNFNPASIFLGDSGALFVGFLLAALSVISAQKSTTAVAVITPLLAFGLPVVDTGVTLARRLIGGRPLFTGDGEHIHHMLLARGWSQRRVVLILYAVCCGFGLFAVLSSQTSGSVGGLVLFVIAAAVIVAVGHLRYHEVDELRAGVKRTVGDRRIRVANNIRVRRAGLALSKATNLGEIFDAVRQMLEFEEFAYAKLELGQPGRADVNERAFRASERRRISQRLEFNEGQLTWSWKRNGLGEGNVPGSSEFWCFRLPLSTSSGEWGWMNLYRPLDAPPLLLDLNYLSGFFRTALSESTERVLLSFAEADSEQLPLVMTAGKIAG